MDEERDLRNCCEEATVCPGLPLLNPLLIFTVLLTLTGAAQAERLQQLTHENELLRTFLGGATAMEENGCAAASLTDEEKCDVATAEVTRLETAIFHHQKSIEQEQVAAEAQLGTWEACAAEAASDLAHLKQHVLEQPNVHTGRICAEHLVRFLDDCQRARDAAIDRCTVQAASARAKLHSMEKAGLAEAEAHDPMDAVTLEKLRIEKVGLREEREQCARELLQAKRKKFDLLQARTGIFPLPLACIHPAWSCKGIRVLLRPGPGSRQGRAGLCAGRHSGAQGGHAAGAAAAQMVSGRPRGGGAAVRRGQQGAAGVSGGDAGRRQPTHRGCHEAGCGGQGPEGKPGGLGAQAADCRRERCMTDTTQGCVM